MPTELPGVLLLKAQLYADARGFFYESYNAREFEQLTGAAPHFVQDNHSHSRRNVLRGLHYQVLQPQAKLVRVVAGEIFDVAVDLRRDAPTFGQHVSAILSAENRMQIYIPEGFAHGFLVLSDSADVIYKSGAYYAPRWERSLLWNDPALGIAWPLHGEPLVSEKDRAARPLREAEVFEQERHTAPAHVLQG